MNHFTLLSLINCVIFSVMLSSTVSEKSKNHKSMTVISYNQKVNLWKYIIYSYTYYYPYLMTNRFFTGVVFPGVFKWRGMSRVKSQVRKKEEGEEG